MSREDGTQLEIEFFTLTKIAALNGEVAVP